MCSGSLLQVMWLQSLEPHLCLGVYSWFSRIDSLVLWCCSMQLSSVMLVYAGCFYLVLWCCSMQLSSVMLVYAGCFYMLVCFGTASFAFALLLALLVLLWSYFVWFVTGCWGCLSSCGWLLESVLESLLWYYCCYMQFVCCASWSCNWVGSF